MMLSRSLWVVEATRVPDGTSRFWDGGVDAREDGIVDLSAVYMTQGGCEARVLLALVSDSAGEASYWQMKPRFKQLPQIGSFLSQVFLRDLQAVQTR